LTAGLNSGSLVVAAVVAADANYNAAAITQTVNISNLTTPTITFTDLTKTYGDPAFSASATSNSVGALTYSIASGNLLATINPSTGLVTILGAGTVTLQVSQAANGTFAATTQTATLTINKAVRTVAITSAYFGAVNSTVNLTAIVSPTATVNWSVTNATGTASVNGSSLTLSTQGQIMVNANVPADANYLSASANQPFTISAITGIETLSANALGLSVYPNPYETESSISVTLPSSSNVSLEIINMVGVTVAKLAENIRLDTGNHTFTLGSLSTATYIIKFTADNHVSYLRVVKQ
jgi:hypothetical protein